MKQNNDQYTVAGTNINEVKKRNAQSGLSYNEVFKLLAQTGGKGTSIFSDTNVEEVKSQLNHN
nr:gamma-type small acid-soluble spore protein [Lysinibacillus timonensis]